MLQIEKGLDFPNAKIGRPRKYPFYDMEIDDCVFVPWRKITDMGSILLNVKGKKFERRTHTRDWVKWVLVKRVS